MILFTSGLRQDCDRDTSSYQRRIEAGERHIVLEMLHVRRKLYRAARARCQTSQSVVADSPMQARMDLQPHNDNVCLDRH